MPESVTTTAAEPSATDVAADARRTGLPSSTFDLAHARTLLVNVPEPAEVLAEMVRLARSDGWVASLGTDGEYSVCYPLIRPGPG
jgi:ubiquinone/menaquinone biosynthesis C-methylase UbiE